MPKRKLEETESGGSGSEDGPAGTESEDSNSSSRTDGSTDVPKGTEPLRKKQKKSVKFDGVTVFYFPRKQGFTCVPSQGGSTLGMGESHATVEKFTLGEYSKVQHQIHRRLLYEQHHQGKLSLPMASKLSMDNQSDSEEEDPDWNIDDYYFLQPVATRQRRIILRQAGVKKIDGNEKDECKDIRSSREVCGCDCQVYCDPETCICSLAGIKCQVDRLSFPCGCSKDGCGNPQGRIEFNPLRVRSHFIHTLMRLELDKKKEQARRAAAISAVTSASAAESVAGSSTSDDCTGQGCGDERCAKTNGKKAETKVAFNSNERGSCCDCQRAEFRDLILRESQLNTARSPSMDHVQQQQQQGSTGQCSAAPHSYMAMSEDAHLGPPPVGNNHVNESLSQVMLFSDDDDYNAENTTGMFPFSKEESSYSESSDCSSEGSVSGEDPSPSESPNPQGFHDFQTMPTFPTTDSSQNSNNSPQGQAQGQGHLQGRNFCIPARDSATIGYEATTAQPEQKYMDMNNTSAAYKLEPISEILNPIRFPGYPTGSSTPSWNNANSYCSYPRANGQTNHSMAPPYPGPQATMDSPKQFSTANPNTPHNSVQNQSDFALYQSGTGSQSSSTTPSAAAADSTSSPPTSVTMSPMFPRADSTTNPSEFSASDNLPSYHTLGTYNGDRQSDIANMDANGNPREEKLPETEGRKKEEERGEEEEGPRYHELKSSCQQAAQSSLSIGFHSDQNHGNHDSEPFIPIPANSNQARAVSTFDLPSLEKDSTSLAYDLANQECPLGVANQVQSAESRELYNLDTATNHKAETLSALDTTQNCINGDGNEMEGCVRSAEAVSPSPEEEQSNTQNFGEIIKESIVETVSA